MSERESMRRQTSRREDEEQVDISAPAQQSFDVSDLLDEIDSVLEENAEEFVKSFVQKGGQ
jgi:ubiquitin-like protein Pup